MKCKKYYKDMDKFRAYKKRMFEMRYVKEGDEK